MYSYNTPTHTNLTFKCTGQSSASLPLPVAVCIHGNGCQQKQRAERWSMPRPHRIHRVTMEQTANSHDSTIGVSAAGAILMGKKVATEGSADVTGPHGFPASSHSRILRLQLFCNSMQRIPLRLKAKLRANPWASHIHAQQELSAARKQPCLHEASPPQQKTVSVPPPPLSAAAWFTALSLYFCLSLMLTHISTSLLFLSLSL